MSESLNVRRSYFGTSKKRAAPLSVIGSTSALRWIVRTHVANRCAMQQPPRAQRAPEPCGASGECRSGALSVQTRERPRRTPASGCERTTARARCTDTARETDTSSLIASTHRRWHADMSLRDHDSACVTGLSLLDQKGFQAHRRTSPASLGVYSDYTLIDVVAVHVPPFCQDGA